MTDKALLKAKIDLFNIISNHAMEDYKRMNCNKNGKRKYRRHVPYSLGFDTIRAKEVYDSIFGKNAAEITLDQEERIKAFLMSYRTHRTEYLKEGYKGGNWYMESLQALF
jgi:hypothetical protein